MAVRRSRVVVMRLRRVSVRGARAMGSPGLSGGGVGWRRSGAEVGLVPLARPTSSPPYRGGRGDEVVPGTGTRWDEGTRCPVDLGFCLSVGGTRLGRGCGPKTRPRPSCGTTYLGVIQCIS